MFDIGFSEMLVIAVVALIVIGPERLPKVARTLGHLFGRMQRYVNDVKADIGREMQLEELKRLQTTIQDAATSFQQSVTKEANSVESELRKVAEEANPLPAEIGAATASGEPAAAALSGQPSTMPTEVATALSQDASSMQPAAVAPPAAVVPAEAHTPTAVAQSAATSDPAQLTPAELNAQLSLDLNASKAPAEKAV